MPQLIFFCSDKVQNIIFMQNNLWLYKNIAKFNILIWNSLFLVSIF